MDQDDGGNLEDCCCVSSEKETWICHPDLATSLRGNHLSLSPINRNK